MTAAHANDVRTAVGERDLAIDRYRGGLVFLMVAGDYLGGVAAVPDLVKHAPGVGLTIADVVAPCFVFAIALTYGPSFRRRAAGSVRGAYAHFLLRYLALIGIGAIISAGGTALAGQPSNWGVLQALGAAGLLCLTVIRLSPGVRIVVGSGLLVAYQIVVGIWPPSGVLELDHGGFVASLAWGALLILSTAFADLRRARAKAFVVCVIVLVPVALLSAIPVPVSKHGVTLSYILISLTVALITYLLADLLSRAVGGRAGYLTWWGENPLALYLLHLLVLALLVLPDASWWYADASPWLAALQLAVVLAIMSISAWSLHRLRVRVHL